MGNVHTFTSHIRSRYGVLDASIDSGTAETAEYVNMANYDLVVFEALASAVISGSALTLKIWQATSGGGAASVSMTHALASAHSTSTHATHCHLLQAQVRGEDLTAGYQYVGAQLAANASVPAPVSIIIHQMRGRYKQATLPA
jgi:hypothetical protein